VFVFALWQQSTEAARRLEKIDKSMTALRALHKLAIKLGRAAIVVMKPEGIDARAQVAQLEDIERLFVDKQELGGLTREAHPELAEQIEKADSLRHMMTSTIDELKGLILNPHIPAKNRLLLLGRQRQVTLMMELHDFGQEIALIERRSRELEPQQIQENQAQTELLMAIGIAASCITTWLSIWFFNRNIATRLRTIEKNGESLAMFKPLMYRDEGADEIGTLDRNLHEAERTLMRAKKKEFAVLERANDVICSLDTNLRFISCSTSAKSAWGFDASDMLGRSILTLVSENTKSVTHESFQKIKSDTQPGKAQNVLVSANGELRDALWSIRWQPDQDRYFCVAHDVTERKNIDRARHSFISMVSHDLRTPLNSIAITCAILLTERKGPLTAEIKVKLEAVERHANELVERVDTILQAAKTGSTTFELESAADSHEADA
ncbi:MAG TPA: PAS domain S-box protein, partial [Chroococcales cyanobacterium]